jgi:hypothetical protein
MDQLSYQFVDKECTLYVYDSAWYQVNEITEFMHNTLRQHNISAGVDYALLPDETTYEYIVFQFNLIETYTFAKLLLA